MSNIITKNIDCCPYTGVRNVKGYVKVREASHVNVFFNGTPNYDQITTIRQGVIYPVVKVEGFGDCEDVTIINDNGEEESFADFFFDEVSEEDVEKIAGKNVDGIKDYTVSLGINFVLKYKNIEAKDNKSANNILKSKAVEDISFGDIDGEDAILDVAAIRTEARKQRAENEMFSGKVFAYAIVSLHNIKAVSEEDAAFKANDIAFEEISCLNPDAEMTADVAANIIVEN